MKYLKIIIAIVFFQEGLAQNTMLLPEAASSPQIEIEQVGWIAGHWQGQAFGGNIEEIWTDPEVGTMMGMFRSYDSSSVSFYEFMTISEQNNSLLLKIKHFSRDLIGWESKEESVEFRLVKVTDNQVFFDGLTFERVSDTDMNIYVKTEREDEDSKEIKFSYSLVK